MSNSRTVTTPRGNEIRTASRRRYILVHEYVERATGEAHTPSIEKRSDKFATLRTFARLNPPRNHASAPIYGVLTIMDTHTGESIPLTPQYTRVSPTATEVR